MADLSPVSSKGAEIRRLQRQPLERDVHRDVKRAYEVVGCFVANLAQGYRPGGKRHGTTRQTKGIPDLYVWPPFRETPPTVRRNDPFWHEVKRPGGKQSPEQRVWEVACKERGVGYVCGGVPEAITYLRTIGIVR